MKLILLFIISFFTINASAAVYKCTDSHGKKEYRPSPCVESSANAEINLKTGNIIDLDAEEKQKRLKREEEEQRLAKERLAMEQAELKKKTLIEQTDNETKNNQKLVKDNPGKFSPFAIPPYYPEKLSPLVKLYEDRLPAIEKFRGQAALKALASKKCGRVELVELSDKSVKDKLVFIVDCSSGKQLYFNEQELAQ